MLYIVGAVVVIGVLYFVFKGSDKPIARSQDNPQGFAHANQTAPVTETEAQ